MTARPRGEEETCLPTNNVASHEVKAVDSHDEAEPAMQAGQLEGDLNGKVPNYSFVAFQAPPPPLIPTGVPRRPIWDRPTDTP